MNDETNIPSPTDQPDKQIPEITFMEMWDLHERMTIPPSFPPRMRLELKKTFYSGIHSIMSAVGLMVDNCKPEEVERRLTALREELEEELAEMLKHQQIYEKEEQPLPITDWKQQSANECARLIHRTIGNNIVFYTQQTAEEIKDVIDRATERNTKQ